MTAADETLLGRLLRYLAGIDAIAHAGPDSYVATTISKAFTTAKGISGSGIFVNCLIPSWTKLHKTLAESGYGNLCDPLHCAFQTGLNSNDHVFEWFAKNPSVLNDFNIFMSAQREGHEYWLDFYPFEQQIGNASQSKDDTTVLFVDIGGRMVLQDLPQTIEQITAGPAMEHMVHDFFTLQPVKGAHAYYFRNIFHDWPEEQCRAILQQTCTAMAKGFSKILINEMVVPLQRGRPIRLAIRH
ncbi:MAG: hypothetical protein ALECFALPRED_000075 [Alectoria fallacina]|uniref:O-methyltransferase C-terminal domain-containing protein n=1 Tax=Alectoria fallacina TaxID=1903189 RepID=A0A8H3EE20_9LECA|nr:MAG: hypothetical protein ALECFALPRED_000075 [Alectoria fallacina]